MSILIRNMEMPKNCCECRFAVDGWCYAKEPTEPNSKSLATHTRPSWCPLIEVPKHGLIDKQMLLRNIADNQFAQSSVGHEEDYAFWGKVWDYIIDAPTIIEAENQP